MKVDTLKKIFSVPTDFHYIFRQVNESQWKLNLVTNVLQNIIFHIPLIKNCIKANKLQQNLNLEWTIPLKPPRSSQSNLKRKVPHVGDLLLGFREFEKLHSKLTTQKKKSWQSRSPPAESPLRLRLGLQLDLGSRCCQLGWDSNVTRS